MPPRPSERIRIGVVGCGLIAQVMHLPHLAQLSDRFELVSVCDLSQTRARGCAERYGARSSHQRWEELLAQPLDAVLVATTGDHAPVAIAAAQAGLHVFVEKSMALCSRDAERMIAAAQRAGVTLMVGTMKRYDPAYERLAELLPSVSDLRLITVTTLEAPIRPYVAHLPLIRGDDDISAELEALERSEHEPIDAAVGDADEQTRGVYREVLLNTLVHELNMLGGLFGAPTEIRSASLAPECVGINMRFGEAECHLSWVLLPGITSYRQELACYAPDQRLMLEFPSPFLANMPSRLLAEGGEPGTAHSWRRAEIVSFDEAFRRELVEFGDCIATGRQPRTSGADGLRDMRVAEAIARVSAAAVSRGRRSSETASGA
jgi:predicted dehydrogenase